MSEILSKEEFFNELCGTDENQGWADRLLAHDTALRLALETATRELDKTRELLAVANALLSRPAPPADAATEAMPCGPRCPHTPTCDEAYPDRDVPDHCERCHHPLACHVLSPAPAPSAKEGKCK
jgi:hypothetical protein